MRTIFSSFFIAAISLILASCGNKKVNKGHLEALSTNPYTSEYSNDYTEQALQIRNRYGIRTEGSLSKALQAIKLDLKDSGIYFSEISTPKPRPTMKEGLNWSAAKLKRKIDRAYRRDKNNGKVPYGIVWKDTIDKCEDTVYSLDHAPEESYGSDVNRLLKEYYDIAQAYLIETIETKENCAEYNEILQIQQQITRVFMRSLPSRGTQQVIGN